MRYRFADVIVDLDCFDVRRNGSPQGVQPQVFDVLVHLIEHRDRVVTKEELLDIVWGDRFVSESSLTSRIKAARRAIGDDGVRQACIRTVHGRGYQFIAGVAELGAASAGADETEGDPVEAGSTTGSAPAFARLGALPPELPRTSFVGRDHDVAAVTTLLAEQRLVTICGMGGVGKTRLALEAARNTARDYRDGVHVVELAGVDGDGDVLSRVASELGVQERSGATVVERIVEGFRGQQVLLVFDNCEHVHGRIAELVDALALIAGVAVLVTSRRPLGVDGEHLWRLAPLPLVANPGSVPPAVALFLDRVRAGAPDLVIDDEARLDIAAICREVDGVPLLVEFAAARVRHAGLRGVREALDDPALLRVDGVGVDRHRSIDALLRWTFDRLGSDERRVLCALSVFASWFDASGVAAVSSVVVEDARPILWRLVDESIVVADVNRPHAPYRLLQPVRAFLGRQLGEGDVERVASRHAGWVLDSVADADAALRSSSSPNAMRRLVALVPDVETALRTLGREGRSADVGQLFGRLFVFAQERVRSDIVRLAEREMELGVLRDEAPAVVLALCAVGAWQRGDLDRAEALIERAAEIPTGNAIDEAIVRLVEGQVLELRGDVTLAFGQAQAAMTAAADAGDSLIQTHALAMCALTSAHGGDLHTGRAWARRAIAVAGSAASPLALCWAQFVAGEVDLETAPDAAIPHLAAAIQHADHAGSSLLRGIAGLSYVSVKSRQQTIGADESLLDEFADLIRHWQLAGMRMHQWATLRNLVDSLARAGVDDAAAVIYGAVTGPLAPVSAHGMEAERLSASAEVLRDRLGAASFDAACAQGAAMAPDQVVDAALAALEASTSPVTDH